MTETRTCTKCRETKPASKFVRRKEDRKDKYYNHCKLCAYASAKTFDAEKARLKRLYGDCPWFDQPYIEYRRWRFGDECLDLEKELGFETLWDAVYDLCKSGLSPNNAITSLHATLSRPKTTILEHSWDQKALLR